MREGSRKTGTAQAETNGSAVDGRALWSESATSVPLTQRRLEHVSVLQSKSGGCGPADAER